MYGEIGLHLGGEMADDEHHQHGDQAAWLDQEAGPGGGVAEILLHQLRQELGGGEQDGAGRQHHQEVAPNWRVATIRRSIIGSRRSFPNGIISTNATAQMTQPATKRSRRTSRPPAHGQAPPRSQLVLFQPMDVTGKVFPVSSQAPLQKK